MSGAGWPPRRCASTRLRPARPRERSLGLTVPSSRPPCSAPDHRTWLRQIDLRPGLGKRRRRYRCRNTVGEWMWSSRQAGAAPSAQSIPPHPREGGAAKAGVTGSARKFFLIPRRLLQLRPGLLEEQAQQGFDEVGLGLSLI